MGARLICTKSKKRQSLSQISKLTGLTKYQVKETLAQAFGLSLTDVSMILNMTHRGVSLEQVHQDTGVDLVVIKQFLPLVIRETVVRLKTQIDAGVSERAVLAHTLDYSPPTTTEETKLPQPTKLQRTFLYSFQPGTNQLPRVNILTGLKSCHEVPDYQFKWHGRWSELPGGSLLITGGGELPGGRDVERIDTLREFAVSSQPPMHTARYMHAAVYHSQYVYVLGYRECERYSCTRSRWEVLPALLVAGYLMSAVEVENSVYALGGHDDRVSLNTVQKLSLVSFTWQLMQLKLPQAGHSLPCFKTDTEVFLVVSQTLYSYTPLQVKAVKTLDRIVRSYSSYYNRGTLYFEAGDGIYSLALGLN